MNPERTFRFVVWLWLGSLIAVVLATLTGCSFQGRRLDRAEHQITETSRQLNQLAALANERTRAELATAQAIAAYAGQRTNGVAVYPSDAADALGGRLGAAADSSALAAGVLDRQTALVGPPAEHQGQRLAGLLSTNAQERTRAEKAESGQLRAETAAVATARAAEDRLVEQGRIREQESNRGIVRRAWAWCVGTLGIGGMIALCIFFPAAIPILGRILAWVVGKLPALAGYIGVVSTKAFDAVVTGVDEFKRRLAPAEKQELNKVLYAEQDAEHEVLVNARRGKT
jgi:hypothetical protein